jgi:hypothetical protein
MATTTNFGWTTPDDTDLVKDGAAAIRTLGSSIDTSLVDLKGGTTGQVLAKASGTDLDFEFITPATSPLTTKGDLFTFSTVAARLPVGTNGQVLTADSAEATGLKFATPAAGGMTQIATGSLSGATTAITSIPATYKNLVVVIRNLIPATDGAFLQVRFNGDSAANRHGSADTTGASGIAYNATAAFIGAASDNAAAGSLHNLTFIDYTNTVTRKFALGDSVCVNADNNAEVNIKRFVSIYNQTDAISSLTFLMNTGNITSGTYILYGVS